MSLPIPHSLCFAVCVLATVAGCTGEPQFCSDELALAEANLPAEQEDKIAATLGELFGTPEEPRVPEGVDLDLERLRMSAGAAGYEKRGPDDEYRQRGLYRQHCASCHGVTGNGIGPSAGMMDPYPRVFTAGVFKWNSTYSEAKPTDADLKRVLTRGVPGTAMASYELLDDAQLDALVEYVKYLSMRGQVEQQLLELSGGTFSQEEVDQIVANVAGSWQQAESLVVEPNKATLPSDNRTDEDLAESIAAGQKLFMSPTTKCFDCHGADGHGGVIKQMDMWNGRIAGFKQRTLTMAESLNERRSSPVPVEQYVAQRQLIDRRREAPDKQMPPQVARARDLHLGVYGGGGERVELFRRIHQGIAGTPMPGQGAPRPDTEGSLTDEQIWQLVDYIESLAPPTE